MPQALTVKHAQSTKELLGETPSLTAVQENRENQTDIYSPLRLLTRPFVSEHTALAAQRREFMQRLLF